jgi:Trk-type K+ transport system membrane component
VLTAARAQSDASFSASTHTLSKLVLMLAMLRGRTRELPIGADRAVLTPPQLTSLGDPPAHESGDRGQEAVRQAGESE